MILAGRSCESSLTRIEEERQMKKVLPMLALAAVGVFAQSNDNVLPSPVPEPASMVMMAAGLAGVAYLGWKRNKKK